MSFLLGLGLGAAAIAALFGGDKKKSIEEHGGKIINKYATIDDVVAHLKEFVPKPDKKLKNNYTEKSVENQLVKYMKQRFMEVTPQYSIGGRIAGSIDIDVADGVAGIELKDAKSVVKAAEFHRMRGQIQDYKKKRYKDDNLILLVVGEHNDKDDSRLLEVVKFCKESNLRYGFFEIGKGYIEEKE